MIEFSLLLEQDSNEKGNAMFSGSEVPSKLGLLLVDDEEFNVKALKRTLRGHGFDIFSALDGKSAIDIMEKEDIAIIISDMRMPNMSGDELLIQIAERWPETLRIVLTGQTDIGNTMNLISTSSIFRYISKPWDDQVLLSTIHEASAIYWGKVMDFYFERSTKKQNQQLQDSNFRLKESVDQSHHQLKKINKKLKEKHEEERRLRKERQEAEQENIAKSQFLATMSHEIRTPLNSIIATSSLLLESQLTDEQKELVNLSLRGGTTLLSLINDILDFSKINAGKLELNEEWFNIVSLVDETCELLSGQVINKPVDIFSIVQPKTPIEVFGDQTRIRQIITNLISNALKFTEYGCVEVEISYNSNLCISVKDSGIGMSDEDVKNIFDEFMQVDSGNTRLKGGTGLGLSICRQLTHLMKGSIDVVSKADVGSKFMVSLPLASRKPIAFPVYEGDERKILLVSSNQILHQALAKQLACFNCGLDIAAQPPSHNDIFFDAILYDIDSICIPTERIISNQDSKVRSSIEVALISNDGVGRSIQVKKQGFGIVLRKPIRIATLIKHLIYKIMPLPSDSDLTLEQRGIIQEWSETKTNHIQKEKMYSLNASVLLAEDSPSNQAVIKSVLKNMDVDVDIANNGEEAVIKSSEKEYDIILMDMAMPIMDGVTAAKTILSSTRSVNLKTPIIALTANAYAEDKKTCTDAGMVDFLQKPIEIDIFRSRLAYWCNRANRKNIEGGDNTMNAPSTVTTLEDVLANENIIDMKMITQLEQDTSKEVLPVIIDIFINETRERLPIMLEHGKKSDWNALSRDAHCLKSSAGSFGAVKLSILAREIEEFIKENNINMIRDHMSLLEPLANATIQSLDALKTNNHQTS